MQAIQILCTLIHEQGRDAFAFSFSAKSVSEDQKMSIYFARKLLKELREYGLVYRMGNRYMFTLDGWNIAHDVIKASQRVMKFQPVRSA